MKCKKEGIEIETGTSKMFDFSDKSSDDVGRKLLCPNENETYDLTAKECRPFSLENFVVQKSDNCSGNFSCDFIECLIFSREEYILNGNCTVEVIPYNKLYGEGKFRITEDGKWVLVAKFSNFDFLIFSLLCIPTVASICYVFLHEDLFRLKIGLQNLSDMKEILFLTTLLVAIGASTIGWLLKVGSKLCHLHSISTQILPLHSYVVHTQWNPVITS